MTDRKTGEEPSLFDLPLRRTPGEGESGSPPEPPREDGGDRPAEARDRKEPDTEGGGTSGRDAGSPDSGKPHTGEPDTRKPHTGDRGRSGAAESRDELAFWEMEPEAGGQPAAKSPPVGTAPAAPPPGDGEEASAGEAEPADWADLEAGEASGGGHDEDGERRERPAAVPAALTHRLAASLLDGGVLLVVTAGAILGAFLLGVRWRGEDLPALGMFVLVFSFVYSVMPLAFWGRTPGMALARVLSRGADGGPLTFGQTALRWLAGLLTVALAGLPLLLALPALGGRSLADRLSGSHTWLQPDA